MKKHSPLLLLLFLDVTAAWTLPISGISQVEYTSSPASNTASGGTGRSNSTSTSTLTSTSTPDFSIPHISAAMDPISTPMASPSQMTLVPSSLPSTSVSSLSSEGNISSSSLAQVSIMSLPACSSAVPSVTDISVYANAETTYITEHETRTVDAEVLSLIIGKYGSNTIRHNYIVIPDPTDQPRPSLTAPSPSPVVFVPSANVTGPSPGIASSFPPKSPSPTSAAPSVCTSPSPSAAPSTCPPPSISSYGIPISPTAQPAPGTTPLVSGNTILTSTLTIRRTHFVTVTPTPTPTPMPSGSGAGSRSGFRFDALSAHAAAEQNEALAGIVRPDNPAKRDVEVSGPKTRGRNVRAEVEKGVVTAAAAAWVLGVAVYMLIWAVGR